MDCWLLEKAEVHFAVLLAPTGRYGEITGMQFQVGIPNSSAGKCQVPVFPSEYRLHLFWRGMAQMQNQAQFFVGWGTLSLINAGLSQSKGRSGFLWWIVSLFLGPIATFLIVVLPANPKA